MVAKRCGLVGLCLAVCASAARADDPVPVRLAVDPAAPAIPIADDFMGLGYETSAVAQPGYFSAKNERLVRLYRNLSPRGLIRIGGNISDHTNYEPAGQAVARNQKETTVVNLASLEDLGTFAEATGWKVMWGLNLGTGSKEMAVAEAQDVSVKLGDRLHSFEIGNEVDALPRFHGKYDQYHPAYAEYKAELRAALPQATFSGPDVIWSWKFLEGFATDESADMRLLTQHYYRSDQSNKREATLENLLNPHPKLAARLDELRDLCKAHHLAGYRINETNSFSGGGKPGVSDTFAGALWALDYLYVLASHGCAGVNIETDINQHAFVSSYSPIVHDEHGVCSARPEYYGLLAFNTAVRPTGVGSRRSIEPLQRLTGGVNVTAYAVRDADGGLTITVINRDLTRDAVVTADGLSSANAYWLRAPAIDAKTDVTLAGSTVADDGAWDGGHAEPVRLDKLAVPHATAVVLRVVGK